MALSQLWLLLCVVAYAAHRLAVFSWSDPSSSMSVEERLQLSVITGFHGDALGLIVTWMYGLIYVLVAVLTLVFQGGLGVYYWRRVGNVEKSSFK